jgi:hypothetical protein
MEREMGIEPTTSSLGRRRSIDNKRHSVFVGLVLAIQDTEFSFWTLAKGLMVFKRCSSFPPLLMLYGCGFPPAIGAASVLAGDSPP